MKTRALYPLLNTLVQTVHTLIELQHADPRNPTTGERLRAVERDLDTVTRELSWIEPRDETHSDVPREQELERITLGIIRRVAIPGRTVDWYKSLDLIGVGGVRKVRVAELLAAQLGVQVPIDTVHGWLSVRDVVEAVWTAQHARPVPDTAVPAALELAPVQTPADPNWVKGDTRPLDWNAMRTPGMWEAECVRTRYVLFGRSDYWTLFSTDGRQPMRQASTAEELQVVAEGWHREAVENVRVAYKQFIY